MTHDVSGGGHNARGNRIIRIVDNYLGEPPSNSAGIVNGFVREFSAGGFSELLVSPAGGILGSDKQEGVEMNEKKKSLWSLLNPLTWIGAIFGSLLRFFGLMPHPQTGGFENIQRADVEDAAKAARETEEAIDAIVADMSPAEVVKAYTSASAEDRAEMDLTALDAEGQDWLLSLSDDDLTLLAMSTTGGCARSLEARAVKPIYPRPQSEAETAKILRIQTAIDEEEEKRAFVAARFRELFLAPGVPNPNPRYVPGTTVH